MSLSHCYWRPSSFKLIIYPYAHALTDTQIQATESKLFILTNKHTSTHSSMFLYTVIYRDLFTLNCKLDVCKFSQPYFPFEFVMYFTQCRTFYPAVCFIVSLFVLLCSSLSDSCLNSCITHRPLFHLWCISFQHCRDVYSLKRLSKEIY